MPLGVHALNVGVVVLPLTTHRRLPAGIATRSTAGNQANTGPDCSTATTTADG